MAKEKCIVLNKPFVGGYLGSDGHDAHEIINFFKADDGNCYIYNTPYGQNVSNIDNYNIEYMVFTSNAPNKQFIIKNVIKIEKSLHNESISKSNISKPQKAKEFVSNAIRSIEQMI